MKDVKPPVTEGELRMIEGRLSRMSPENWRDLWWYESLPRLIAALREERKKNAFFERLFGKRDPDGN